MERKCKCARLCEHTQLESRINAMRVGETGCEGAPAPLCSPCALCMSLRMCFWALKCWAGGFVVVPPLGHDYVVAGGSAGVHGAWLMKPGLPKARWRSGVAWSRGRSAPSATRAAGSSSTRVSTEAGPSHSHPSVQPQNCLIRLSSSTSPER